MIRIIPIELYPVAIVQDRYGGGYSGGMWLAVVDCTEAIAGRSRIDWVLNEGPSGGDGDAAEFWCDPPSWIAAASNPDAALLAVLAKNGYEDPSTLMRSPFPMI